MRVRPRPPGESKDRILHAAEQVFARKGYDGARVDEIARKAEVNKALIYYYFKSKEEILHALIHHTINDFLSDLESPEVFLEKSLSSLSSMKDLFLRLLKLVEERRDLFTIVMMELLKDTKNRTLILSHLIKEIHGMVGPFRKYGIKEITEQHLVTEFFTGLIPVFMFVLLKEPWQKLSGTKDEAMRQMFLNALELTHIRYTFTLLGKEGT